MAASTWIPPTLPECNGYDGAVLLDLRCYTAEADLRNATTASGATSRGRPIQVTFRAARPPLLSCLCVHCPGLDVFRIRPRVVATDADLVLLRVPININACLDVEPWDYFVYSPRAHRLDLLPNPYPMCFRDSAAALLSREDGAWYAIAAISSWCPVYEGSSKSITRWDFSLHLYRSSDSEGWITMPMSLEELVRDKLLPLPAAASNGAEDDDDVPLYHKTSKTLSIGGERGTVAWVDLWRGILLCDVLREEHRPIMVFQDIPLPMPARGNMGRFLRQCEPNFIRDVAITRHKDTIKFVEMEIWPQKRQTHHVIPGGWKATTWSMPIPPLPVVGSFADWQTDCEAQIGDVTGDPHHWNLLSKLSGGDATPALQKEKLFTAYPTISIDDDDIVYFVHSNDISLLERLELVIAVDVRNKTLRGVAEIDVQKKNFILMPVFCTSDICRHMRKTTAVSSQ